MTRAAYLADVLRKAWTDSRPPLARVMILAAMAELGADRNWITTGQLWARLGNLPGASASLTKAEHVGSIQRRRHGKAGEHEIRLTPEGGRELAAWLNPQPPEKR